jgi:hypothetical protein
MSHRQNFLSKTSQIVSHLTTMGKEKWAKLIKFTLSFNLLYCYP